MTLATRRSPAARRPGFTLVELLVAAAVCVIIMTVLATAFQTGIDTMRQMKSVGDMQDQLRAVTEIIRRDLQADHFLAQDTPVTDPGGQKVYGAKLSGQRTDDPQYTRPNAGFFRIVGSTSQDEGTDPDGLHSYRSTGSDHRLHFTAILPGDKAQNTYTTTARGQPYSSRAAEIAYFLDPSYTGQTGSVNLYRLCRRQRLVALRAAERGPLANANDTTVVAKTGGANPTVATLANMAAASSNARLTLPSVLASGDDVLLSNVTSFEVKADTGQPASTFGSNKDYPFALLPGNEFDTGGTSKPSVRVKALQIRIRIYDPKVRSSRQVTIVQDM